MIESLPKLADLKLLKELSKVIITPMLIAAVIIQTGLEFESLSIEVKEEDSLFSQGIKFSIIFLVKGSLTAMFSVLIHQVLIYLHIITNFFALHALSILFLAFGFIGLFAGEELLFLKELNKMWFYTSFVSGFYFLATIADIEEIT
jgi:hypothetical protein